MTTSCAAPRVRGLGLILSPSTPMPAWASRCKKGRKATCKPSPKAYGAFVTALGRRYSGAYADENQGGGVLPRVRRWSLLNEPNQPGWLTPQYERKKRRLVATAAVVYRALATAGHQGPAGERPRPRPDPARRDVADRAHERIARAPPDPAGRVPAQALLPQPERAPPARRRRARARLPQVQAPRGQGLRPPPLPARRLAAARRAAAGRGRDHDLLALAAAPRARPGGARPPHPAPPAGLLHGVRLPDEPARPHLRRPRGAAGGLHQPVRLDGLPRPPRARGGAVQARRRGVAVELPVRPALPRRPRRSPPTTPTGCRSGSAAAARGCGSTARCARRADSTPQVVQIQNRPPSGGAFTTVTTLTVRSRKGHFLTRVPKRAGVWRLQANGLTSREAQVAPR